MRTIYISDQTLKATPLVPEIEGREGLGGPGGGHEQLQLYVQTQKDENMAHLIARLPDLERCG